MKGTGPFLNRNFYDQDRPRALFSDMPIGPTSCGDFQEYFEDFAGTMNGDILVLVKDAGASGAVVADAENGGYRITSTATTSGDGGNLQAVETTFLCVAGRALMFEARVRVSDADQSTFFVGLADTIVTNPEDVVVAGVARIGFELLDGAATLNTVVDDDTTAVKVVTAISAVDATYIRLGFRLDGASVRFYINRALVGTTSLPSAIAAVTLGPSFMHLSGDATGTHTADCDYIHVISKRS